MTDREKLVEMISEVEFPSFAAVIADHLIANGVTFADCLEEKQATSDAKTSDWISVEDMLPVPDVNVIVTRKSLISGGIIVGIDHITSFHREGNTWGYDHKSWKFKVTHWMPLPKPPKGE